MKENNEVYGLIYEFFESRILFGNYRYGDRLISVPKICVSFKVGRNTVQAAMDKLEGNGYIKTGGRKVAEVVYRGNEKTFRKNAAEYFVPRREGIIDFCHMGELLFQPLWEKGLPALMRDAQSDTYRLADTVGVVLLPTPTKLFFDVLYTFHNELLLSLYWQCLRYLNFLYPKRNEEEINYFMENAQSQDVMGDMKSMYDLYFDNLQTEVLNFVDDIYEKCHLENVSQIPFRWTIYRRRPQIRYTLASTLIREILCGKYPVDSYLPSLPRLAEQYGVSVSTVRRTLDVLHSLGVTKACMGIGIKVCLEPADNEIMNVPEIRENLRLHGEAMQILALTVRGVLLFTLEAASKEKKETFLQNIRQLHGKNNGILCIDVLLSFISSECPSESIRECYGKLRELAAWGYIFSAVLKGNGQLKINLTDFISRLEINLQTDNFTAFAGQWQSFIEERMHFFYEKFPF